MSYEPSRDHAVKPLLPGPAPRYSRDQLISDPMKAVQAEIVEWLEDGQPGVVRARFVDAHGRAWDFVEKLPMVTAADLDSSSCYPQPAVIGCQVVDSRRDAAGRELLTVDTELPWHLESVEEVTRFEVLAQQVIDL